jgi:N-methylhydantoinase A
VKKIGVDVGGTFTDLVVIDDLSGKINLTKVPSTPRSPDQGVLSGIEKVARQFSVKPEEVQFLIHGTTVATNALIERKGVETALVVTKGFRDVLHIARQTRPKLYDFFARRPDPFIPRHLRFEVEERILADGKIDEPLNEENVRLIARAIKDSRVRVVAVCLLHSYINPVHEKRVREILLEMIPELKVSISNEILPEFKEYERMSTTVINAYVMPIVEVYMQRILQSIKRIGVLSNLHIMQSNGGVMSSETAGQKSVHTVLSGPAAGVIGAIALAKLAGEANLITIDMGGTSFDVSLVRDGIPTFTMESDIDGHIIKIPMIDIKTLGAGGGSIAWVDAGGALQVGPQSAGADPGPACYDQGGTSATVTDANLVLGYLNPTYFAAGEMELNVEKARQAVEKNIGKPMGLKTEEAAEGILRVVNATMIRGIRLVSVERGYDPREFSLVCFGGAGPVHAVKLAQELNIPKIVVPEAPGVNCALGLLMADFRHDYSHTFLHLLKDLAPDRLIEQFEALENHARQQMIEEGVPEKDILFHRSGDLRFFGQGYELNMPLPRKKYNPRDLEEIGNGFAAVHEEQYGYSMRSETVQIVNLRLTAIGLLTKPGLEEEPDAGTDPEAAFKGSRSIFMEEKQIDAKVFDRKKLRCGNEIEAPAIIEQVDSTTVLFPRYRARVDEYRNLIIEKKEN